jgi:hypothetical protein
MNAARAFLWEYRRRHQLGLILLAAYLLAFLVLQATVIGSTYRIRLDPPNGFAFFVILPAVAMLFYTVGAFTYGLSGDLAARESIYPRRMLTLPVATTALAGWPMLFGATSGAALWIVMAFFLRIAGAEYRLPLLWPALLCGAYVAWMQALTWMPYGLRGIRVVAALLWLFIVDAVVITAFTEQAPNALMLAIVAPQLPMAYLVACVGVARARRGVVPDWSAFLSAPASPLAGLFHRQRRFRSASSAQLWFEWRRSGRALPVMVAIVVPAELTILFIPGSNTLETGIVVSMFALLMPQVLAFFSATTFGTPTPFMTTRPLSDAALTAAKLKATMISTLMAWAIVLVAIPAALIASGASIPVMEELQTIVAEASTVHAVTFAIFAVGALMMSTWGQLLRNLCISLTGNVWLIKSTVVIGLVMMAIGGPGLQWFFSHPRAQAAVWEALPLIAIALVAAKFIAAALAASKLHARRVIGDRGLITLSAGWLLLVALIYAAISWWFASPLMPAYFKAAVAILFLPLARVLATPLSLSWSRHQRRVR